MVQRLSLAWNRGRFVYQGDVTAEIAEDDGNEAGKGILKY